MLPLVVSAGMLWADLSTPVTAEEYRYIVGQLAGFLHKGMTDGDVRQVLGVRADGRVRAGERWTVSYSLLGLTVRYRLAEVGSPGKGDSGS